MKNFRYGNRVWQQSSYEKSAISVAIFTKICNFVFSKIAEHFCEIIIENTCTD